MTQKCYIRFRAGLHYEQSQQKNKKKKNYVIAPFSTLATNSRQKLLCSIRNHFYFILLSMNVRLLENVKKSSKYGNGIEIDFAFFFSCSFFIMIICRFLTRP